MANWCIFRQATSKDYPRGRARNHGESVLINLDEQSAIEATVLHDGTTGLTIGGYIVVGDFQQQALDLGAKDYTVL